LTTAVNVKAILLADPVMSRDISLLQLKQRMLSPAALRMKETLICAREGIRGMTTQARRFVGASLAVLIVTGALAQDVQAP